MRAHSGWHRKECAEVLVWHLQQHLLWDTYKFCSSFAHTLYGISGSIPIASTRSIWVQPEVYGNLRDMAPFPDLGTMVFLKLQTRSGILVQAFNPNTQEAESEAGESLRV